MRWVYTYAKTRASHYVLPSRRLPDCEGCKFTHRVRTHKPSELREGTRRWGAAEDQPSCANTACSAATTPLCCLRSACKNASFVSSSN